MTLLGGTSGYKVLCVSKIGYYQVYDSTENSWSTLQHTPAYICSPWNQAASDDGTTLYFMHIFSKGLVSYDTIKGTWRHVVFPLPTESDKHVLAGCGGKIILVGQLCKNDGACLCIWELQKTETTMLWKEVDMMPEDWYLDFYKLTCLGNNGLLMLALSSRQKNLVVTYDPLS